MSLLHCLCAFFLQFFCLTVASVTFAEGLSRRDSGRSGYFVASSIALIAAGFALRELRKAIPQPRPGHSDQKLRSERVSNPK